MNSTCGNELNFTWVGIHFAWMRVNYYNTIDLSINPVGIQSEGSCTFHDIMFTVSSNASVGWNEFNVRIHYDERGSDGWTSGRVWTSSTHRIYVHDAYEKTYRELSRNVFNGINDAQKADYESPYAESLLSQAVNEYDLALASANQEKWKEAISNLQTASNLLDQASDKEEEYQRQKQRELETWRRKAIDSISLAEEKINRIRNCESADAESLLGQAETLLTNSRNSFDHGSFKEAYNYALEASSYADQASTKEQKYQKEKEHLLEKEREKQAKEQEYQLESEKAFGSIEIAEEKISQVMDVESPDAKILLHEAHNQLKDAKNSYSHRTMESFETAYSKAQQAIEYAEQADTKEQRYLQMKLQQRQLILIVVGISVTVVVVIIAVALDERNKWPLKI